MTAPPIQGWPEFDRATVELVAPGVLEEDLIGLDALLHTRGIDVSPALYRQLYRNQLQVSSTDFVAGRLPFIRVALQRLGLPMPTPLDYLGASEAILGRRVWLSTLGAVTSRLYDRGEPLFIKPAAKAKRFTGRVVSEPADLAGLPMTSPSAAVWCSEPIVLLSEHRVFVRHGEIVGIRHYDKDASLTPATAEVMTIVDELRPRLPAGCAIDVGVTQEGSVVLVEANDGFSLGRYGLDAAAYLSVLQARWDELVRPV